MGCCFTRHNSIKNDIPIITITMKYNNGKPNILVETSKDVSTYYYMDKVNTKGIRCKVNNTQHTLIINVDDAYNGVVPMGPPFENDNCIVHVDNNAYDNNSSLIQRSPLVKSYTLDNNPTTIIGMLKYLNGNNNHRIN
jgi:hypothetical protein